MPPALEQWACEVLGVRAITSATRLQSLWSGYGAVVRLAFPAGAAILKRVAPPTARSHPRGWASDRSHQRKLRSYEVEATWYRDFAGLAPVACRVPRLLASHVQAGERWFLLEDLDEAGFPGRQRAPSSAGVSACLEWLAAFHGTFLGRAPEGLWERGTYWHLATRPDELAATRDAALRAAAPGIDARLSEARFRTFVHGDAKPANFCFTPAGDQAAAVDFQYVGGGVGVQDVAYLLGACLRADEVAAATPRYLEEYFRALAPRLGSEAAAVEAEWRALFPWAWADFERFLAGWAPDHSKRSAFSERMTRQVLAEIR